MVKVILGSFDVFPIFDNLACRKRLVIERNGVKFGPRAGGGGVIQCIQGTLDSEVFKVILGSLGAFSIFDNLVSRKLLVLR